MAAGISKKASKKIIAQQNNMGVQMQNGEHQELDTLLKKNSNGIQSRIGYIQIRGIKIAIRTGAKAMYKKARPMPFALKDKVEQEIRNLTLSRIEARLATLHGGVAFSKLDLSRAYAQIPLDPESRKIVTINTHIGLFKCNRLPYGVSSDPGSFQKIMDQTIGGRKGVGIFLDDVLITAGTREMHLTRLA